MMGKGATRVRENNWSAFHPVLAWNKEQIHTGKCGFWMSCGRKEHRLAAVASPLRGTRGGTGCEAASASPDVSLKTVREVGFSLKRASGEEISATHVYFTPRASPIITLFSASLSTAGV